MKNSSYFALVKYFGLSKIGGLGRISADLVPIETIVGRGREPKNIEQRMSNVEVRCSRTKTEH